MTPEVIDAFKRGAPGSVITRAETNGRTRPRHDAEPEASARPAVIDLAAEERKARTARQAASEVLADALAGTASPRVHLHRFGLRTFVAGALTLAIGGAGALLGSSLATDWLLSRCLWPGMECVPIAPVPYPTAAPPAGGA